MTNIGLGVMTLATVCGIAVILVTLGHRAGR
jgi:hypothetical protein